MCHNLMHYRSVLTGRFPSHRSGSSFVGCFTYAGFGMQKVVLSWQNFVSGLRQCIDEKRSKQEMKNSYPAGSITDEPEYVAAEMTKWRTGTLQPTVKVYL